MIQKNGQSLQNMECCAKQLHPHKQMRVGTEEARWCNGATSVSQPIDNINILVIVLFINSNIKW